VACDGRGLASYPIPWDRAPGPGTFIATCRAIYAELRLVFPSFPEGSVAKALTFAASVDALVFVTIWLGEKLARPRSGPPPPALMLPTVYCSIVLAPPPALVLPTFYSSIFLAMVVAAGTTFYVSQKVLGGRASLRTCLRAAAYLSALFVMLIPTVVAPGLLGAIIILAAVSMWCWAWLLLGQGRGGLSRARAAISVFVTLVASAVVGLVMLSVLYAVYLAATGQLPK
jgi:hypothetical protein